MKQSGGAPLKVLGTRIK